MTALAMARPTSAGAMAGRRSPRSVRELGDLPQTFNAMQRLSLREVAIALGRATPGGHPVCPSCDIIVTVEPDGRRWRCTPGCACRGDVLDLIAMHHDVMGQRTRSMRLILADAQNNDARFRHRAQCLRPQSRALVSEILAFCRKTLGRSET